MRILQIKEAPVWRLADPDQSDRQLLSEGRNLNIGCSRLYMEENKPLGIEGSIGKELYMKENFTDQ